MAAACRAAAKCRRSVCDSADSALRGRARRAGDHVPARPGRQRTRVQGDGGPNQAVRQELIRFWSPRLWRVKAHADDSARVRIDRLELPARRMSDALTFFRDVPGEQENEPPERVDFVLVR